MQGYRIVIADDEPQILNSMSLLLETAGHVVVGKASTGEEAVWMTQTLTPELVMLDVQMPGMDGISAAKTIMRTKPMPIVMCTAYYDEKFIDAAAKVGAYGYVVKPCRLANILPAMNMAVTRYHDNRLLHNEVASLRESIEARKWVEQAKGVIMKTRHISEDEAHRFLQRESQSQSTPLAELAKAVVLAQGSLCPKIIGSGISSKS